MTSKNYNCGHVWSEHLRNHQQIYEQTKYSHRYEVDTFSIWMQI